MYGRELKSALQDADRTIDMTLTRIATGLADVGVQQAAFGDPHGRTRPLSHQGHWHTCRTCSQTHRMTQSAITLPSTLHGLKEPGLLSTPLRSNLTTIQHQLMTQLDRTEAQQLPDLVQQIATRAQHEGDAIRHGTPITAQHPVAPWHRPFPRRRQSQPN